MNSDSQMTEEEPKTSNVDLDKILHRVRQCIAKAENLTMDAEKPDVSEGDRAAYLAEADAARTMADTLMLQYAIKEVGAAAEDPTKKVRPIIITVSMGPDSEISGYFSWLSDTLIRHCRCKVRRYTSWSDGGYNMKVYGFESDVRYFELMYTTVLLHMMGVLLPRFESSRSLDENVYVLHNSGHNWLQIAEMDGWKKYNSMRWSEYDGTMPPAGMKVPYYHKNEGWHPSTTVGGKYKRAYYRACEARGEQPLKVAANGTRTYRTSAADGYVAMIQQRLWRIEKDRQHGAELILASRVNDLDKLFREDNPDLFVERPPTPAPDPSAKQKKVRPRKYVPAPFNEEAYRRGAAHAKTADLNGNSRMGHGGQNALDG